MKFYPGSIYHVYNRGNNQQKIFFEEKNYLFFLEKMRKHLLQYCDILAWCLMPNPFHWMIHIAEDYIPETGSHSSENKNPFIEPLNMSISTLLSSYTKAMNNMYNRTGSLFQRRTKSKELSTDLKTDVDYPLTCFLYIHQNPLRAGLVENLVDWKFSSFRDYSGFRQGRLCNLNLAIRLLELPVEKEDFIRFSKKTIPDYYVDRIM